MVFRGVEVEQDKVHGLDGGSGPRAFRGFMSLKETD